MEAKSIMKVRVARRPQGGLCVPLSEGPDTKTPWMSVTQSLLITGLFFSFLRGRLNEHARWLLKISSVGITRLAYTISHEVVYASKT
jgi:hypothetical protein